MPAPKFTLPVAGSGDPRYSSKIALEDGVNEALAYLYEVANPEDRIRAEDAAELSKAEAIRSSIEADRSAAQVPLAAEQVDLAAVQAGLAEFEADRATAEARNVTTVAQNLGPVAGIYDTRAQAEAAGLADQALFDVIRDETEHNAYTRYRRNGAGYDLKMFFNLETLPDLDALKSVRSLYSGQVARVIDDRIGGHFKWASGDMSALVSADPYGGLYVAPASDPTGASGAWRRMVEKSTWDAEWWLPDAMPADAQTYINSGILAIPGNAGKFLLPRRMTTVTDALRFAKALEYEGFGESCPVDGQGNTIQCVYIMASNTKLKRISAGNAYGAMKKGEAGAFHIFDGNQSDYGSGETIENISAKDLHAYNGELGFRAGHNAHPTDFGTIYPSREIYLENFRAEGIERIGIEASRSHMFEINGGVIRMMQPAVVSGFDRGARIVGARDTTIIGTRFICAASDTARGVSLELGSNQGNVSGSVRTICEGVTVEDATTAFVAGPGTQELDIHDCAGISRREDISNVFFGAASASTNFTHEAVRSRTITLKDNRSTNLAMFATFGDGHLYGLLIEDNLHISSSYDRAGFLAITTNPNKDERLIDAVVRRNKAYVNPNSLEQHVEVTSNPNVEITFADNEMNESYAFDNDSLINFRGDAVAYIPNRTGNKFVPAERWSQLKTYLAQEEYTGYDPEINY